MFNTTTRNCDAPIEEYEVLESIIARKASPSKATKVIDQQWLAVAAETIASIINANEDLIGINNAYTQKAENVFIANHNSRNHFYSSGLPYTEDTYLQTILLEFR